MNEPVGAPYRVHGVKLSIERPLGIRLIAGRFQLVVGYLNRFAAWWDYWPLVNLYRGKTMGPVDR